MNHLIFYPADCHFNIILEYLYDEYPDKITNFVYNNECCMNRYEYRFRRFKDRQSIKSILPHDCDFSFTKHIDDDDIEFECKLDIIHKNECIPDRYFHNLGHDGGEDRILKKLVISSDTKDSLIKCK